ncbi:phage regulatory CII family protein [Oxalobacteraceae bacterium A2-2]
MNILDAIQNTARSAPGGIETLAVRMGLGAQLLRNKVNANVSTNYLNPLELQALLQLTGDMSVLHALAREVGHVCIPIQAEAAASDVAILELVTQVWSASGEVGTEVHATLADGIVEQHEIERVKAAVYRVNRALADMVSRLEGMAEK